MPTPDLNISGMDSASLFDKITSSESHAKMVSESARRRTPRREVGDAFTRHLLGRAHLSLCLLAPTAQGHADGCESSQEQRIETMASVWAQRPRAQCEAHLVPLEGHQAISRDQVPEPDLGHTNESA